MCGTLPVCRDPARRGLIGGHAIVQDIAHQHVFRIYGKGQLLEELCGVRALRHPFVAGAGMDGRAAELGAEFSISA